MLKTALTLSLIALLSGCAHQSEIKQGTPFSQEAAAKITKNKTTTADLLQLLGSPAYKSVVSGNEEKWTYSYTTGKATAQAFSAKVKGSMETHTLDVLIKDGTVINFTRNTTQQNL